MKWLYRLQYKYGKYYIPNLMTIITAGMGLVYVVMMFAGQQGTALYFSLMLNRDAILSGQVWRLVTFIFLPTSTSPFWFFLSLYLYYFIGNSLENVWGGFRFNIYYLFGILGTIIGSFIVGFGTNQYINLSLFLAFATITPDTTFNLFFFLPVKAKWMALAYVASILYTIVTSPTGRLQLLFLFTLSLINYLVFFGHDLINTSKEQIRIYKNRRNWRNSNK